MYVSPGDLVAPCDVQSRVDPCSLPFLDSCHLPFLEVGYVQSLRTLSRMSGRYLIRLDDIAPHMAWDRFYRLARVFDAHGVKPLIGVIPDNQDPQLRQWPEFRGDFWAEIRSLQAGGWEIAQHGFQHLYVTRDRGLMGVNGLSEFAGLPFEKQFDKLARGQSLLRQQGLSFESFMAPSHSFDLTTLQALKELKFTTVTDGFALFPYTEHGLIFLPQLLASPRVIPFGVQTFCLHVNVMTEVQVLRVEEFIARHHREFITFSEARALATPRNFHRLAGRVVGATLRSLLIWRRRRRLKTA